MAAGQDHLWLAAASLGTRQHHPRSHALSGRSTTDLLATAPPGSSLNDQPVATWQALHRAVTLAALDWVNVRAPVRDAPTASEALAAVRRYTHHIPAISNGITTKHCARCSTASGSR
jgi:hypothetical protein